MTKISIVLDFTDVFPDEVPCLPPAREVEFAIDFETLKDRLTSALVLSLLNGHDDFVVYSDASVSDLTVY